MILENRSPKLGLQLHIFISTGRQIIRYCCYRAANLCVTNLICCRSLNLHITFITTNWQISVQHGMSLGDSFSSRRMSFVIIRNIHTLVHLSTYQSICLSLYLSVKTFIPQFIHLAIQPLYPFIYLPVCLTFLLMKVYLIVWQSYSISYCMYGLTSTPWRSTVCSAKSKIFTNFKNAFLCGFIIIFLLMGHWYPLFLTLILNIYLC
jgi:hypothetical protein